MAWTNGPKLTSIRNKVARENCYIPADCVVKEIFGKLVGWRLVEKVPGTDRSPTAYRKGPKYREWKRQKEE